MNRDLVLGIETSCDETAAAVVERGRTVLSNIIASQDDLHAEYRGVVPEIASRAHAERILPVVRRAFTTAGIAMPDLRAVAVGHRPGLIGSLLVGVGAAKALAWSLRVPVVGVDHVHAHLYAGCLGRDEPPFPALGLVVSGGHTSLYRCESVTRISRLGATIDDAVGEAYDKAATVLGLPYPGGPNLDRLAQTGNPRAVRFPVSRLGPDSLDFSFSGLKTSLLYAVRGVPNERQDRPPKAVIPHADLAASFQRAAIDAIMLKVRRALDQSAYKSMLIGGGVSANSLLRAELADLAREIRLELRLPDPAYCLDNGAMIAGLGYRILENRAWVSDPLSLSAVPTTAC